MLHRTQIILHAGVFAITHEVKDEIAWIHAPGIGIQTPLGPHLAERSPTLGDRSACALGALRIERMMGGLEAAQTPGRISRAAIDPIKGLKPSAGIARISASQQRNRRWAIHQGALLNMTGG